jgi:hypothetical protein
VGTKRKSKSVVRELVAFVLALQLALQPGLSFAQTPPGNPPGKPPGLDAVVNTVGRLFMSAQAVEETRQRRSEEALSVAQKKARDRQLRTIDEAFARWPKYAINFLDRLLSSGFFVSPQGPETSFFSLLPKSVKDELAFAKLDYMVSNVGDFKIEDKIAAVTQALSTGYRENPEALSRNPIATGPILTFSGFREVFLEAVDSAFQRPAIQMTLIQYLSRTDELTSKRDLTVDEMQYLFALSLADLLAQNIKALKDVEDDRSKEARDFNAKLAPIAAFQFLMVAGYLGHQLASSSNDISEALDPYQVNLPVVEEHFRRLGRFKDLLASYLAARDRAIQPGEVAMLKGLVERLEESMCEHAEQCFTKLEAVAEGGRYSVKGLDKNGDRFRIVRVRRELGARRVGKAFEYSLKWFAPVGIIAGGVMDNFLIGGLTMVGLPVIGFLIDNSRIGSRIEKALNATLSFVVAASRERLEDCGALLKDRDRLLEPTPIVPRIGPARDDGITHKLPTRTGDQ